MDGSIDWVLSQSFVMSHGLPWYRSRNSYYETNYEKCDFLYSTVSLWNAVRCFTRNLSQSLVLSVSRTNDIRSHNQSLDQKSQAVSNTRDKYCIFVLSLTIHKVAIHNTNKHTHHRRTEHDQDERPCEAAATGHFLVDHEKAMCRAGSRFHHREAATSQDIIIMVIVVLVQAAFRPDANGTVFLFCAPIEAQS